MKLVELRKLSQSEHENLDLVIGFQERNPVLIAKKQDEHTWALYKNGDSNFKKVIKVEERNQTNLEDILAYFVEKGLKPFCIEPQSDSLTVSMSIEARKDEADRRRELRKDVDLSGEYQNSRTGKSRKVQVVNVSSRGLMFNTSDPEDIQLKDFLSFSFKLDNSKKSTIKRNATVRHIKKNQVGIVFINPPAFDMDFDFYLLSNT